MKKKFECFILSFISAFTLFFNFKKLYLGKNPFSILNIVLLVLFTFIFYIFYTKNDYKNISKEDKILLPMFSIFVLVGQSYRDVGSLSILFRKYMFFFTIIRFIGFYNILNLFMIYIKKTISIFENRFNLKDNKFIKLFNKHPFLVSFFVLIFCYSIYYIAYYPAVLSPDPSNQIKQAFNVRTKYVDYSIQIDPKVNLTNHHPVLHTLMLGYSVKLGRLLVNDNFGLFIYTFFQGLFLVLTLSYSISYLKKKGVSNKYLLLMLLLYVIMPCFSFYAINTNKDVYYSILMIWLTIFLIEFIEKFKSKKIEFKWLLLSFVLMMFICLFRNNGIFLVLLLLPFMCNYSKINKKRIICLVFAIFISYISYSKILLPALHITGTTVREVLSIPFQQTARYIKYHEEDLTEEDKKNISGLLNYDIIKTKYKPKLSDPVKATFNKYATKEDFVNYAKTWFKGFYTHPFTYIDATLNNIYGYFDIGDLNWYLYTKFDKRITENNLVDYHFNGFKHLRSFLSGYGNAYRCLPVIGLFVNIGFNVWIVISMTVYLIKQNKKKYLIVISPMLVAVFFCILSPANNYFRYALPFIFPMPLVIMYLLNLKKIEKVK